MVTCCHLLSLVVTRCNTRCHSLCHLLSFAVTRCHSLSLVVALAVTRCHLLPLDVPLVCIFIKDLNIILDYLEKTVYNVFTITTDIQGGVLLTKSSKIFKKILEKYIGKSSFLVKLQVLKMNLFTHTFQGFY